MAVLERHLSARGWSIKGIRMGEHRRGREVVTQVQKDGSMKQLIRMTVVLAFSVYVAPGMAFDNGGSVKDPVTFAAFRHMSTLEGATLTPLTDTELATIEGASLAGLMGTVPPLETIFLAILEAQRGTLGCNASCVVQ